MRYELDNGKVVNIPDADIERNMKIAETREEAIQIWLEDEGIEVNEEQQKLNEKTKGQRMDIGARAEKPKRKPREVVEKKDEVKEEIIRRTAELLRGIAANVKIENKRKLITFTVGDEEFKFDLVRKRPAKK